MSMRFGPVKTWLTIILFTGVISCRQNVGNQELDNASIKIGGNSGIKYAKGFNIEYFSDHKRITIFNPWQGAREITITYCLADEGTNLNDLPEETEVIRVPVERIICMSTTHIGMLDFTGKLNTLVGVSGSVYINNSWVRNHLDDNQILDIGYDQNIHYEKIVALKPDLVMTYGVGSEVTGYINKLKELGIPVIINGDYLEQSPLAKAEWVKVVASLYGSNELVNRKFELLEKEYHEVKKLAAKATTKPTVMIGLPWKDAWYIPGGNSFAANFIRDAGGSFIWEDKQSVEAIPFNIEAVYEQARDADFWINTGIAQSLEDILSIDERLIDFKPVILGTIYNNNNIINEFGGNDYWESGIMNPHKILRDLTKIFHPGILPDHQLVYYKKINSK